MNNNKPVFIKLTDEEGKPRIVQLDDLKRIEVNDKGETRILVTCLYGSFQQKFNVYDWETVKETPEEIERLINEACKEG